MFAAIFTVAALAIGVFAEDLSINTPKAVATCKEVVITWQHGKAPYNISVVPGDDPCDDALVVLPTTTDTWFKWQNPQLAAGTKVIFAVEDANGDEAWSDELTIQNGTTTSCPSPSGSASASGDSGSATTLVVPASATQTVPASNGDTNGDVPVANAQGALGGAPTMKGGYTAVGISVFVAFVSAALAF